MSEKNLEDCSLEEVKNVLRSFKAKRKAIADEAKAVHDVYEKKVLRGRIEAEVGKLTPAQKETYRELLSE